MYKIRMDLNKKAHEVQNQEQRMKDMKEQNEKLLADIGSLNERDKQYSNIQTDLEKYLDILSQVDRHLKTLIKFLKNVVDQSSDPQIIEHTQRQIKGIENVHKDIKKAIYHNDYCSSEASKTMDNLFSLQEEAAKLAENASCNHQNRKPEESLNSSGRPSIGTRSLRSNQNKQAQPGDKATKSASLDREDNDFKHPGRPSTSVKQKQKENDAQIVKKEKVTKVAFENSKASMAHNLVVNDVNVSRASDMTMATKAGAKANDNDIVLKKDKNNKRV